MSHLADLLRISFTPTNKEHETIMLALFIADDCFAFLQNDHTLWLRKLIATFEIKQ